MPHSSRPPELIGGPYLAPRHPVGRHCRCAVRGVVRIDGLTDAPIAWPYTHPGGRYPSLIVRGGLLRALRVESAEAIAHHWGVSRYYVSRLRAALGLTRGAGRGYTAGALRLLESRRPRGEAGAGSKLDEPAIVEMRRLYSGGARVADLARRFGASFTTAHRAISGRTWAHVPGAVPIRGPKPDQSKGD